MRSKGILVGCNKDQEWLLSWWWGHFHKHNPEYRVAFADFGMSEQARVWCEEKGQLITLSGAAIAIPTDKNRIACWEKRWEKEGRSGDLWMQRTMWFKKPAAMAQSPFYRTLWLDLDCEVKGNVKELFSTPLSSAKMGAMSWESNVLLSQANEIIHQFPQYNSGVLLFEKDSPLLNLWIETIEKDSERTCADDDLLSVLAAQYQMSITSLPILYNWEALKLGLNPDAQIYHWIGGEGKESILRKIYLEQIIVPS